jgi:hypothetical protein
MDERRADARSSRVLENDQCREPRHRVVVVNRWKNVSRYQPDDFTISVRCHECGRLRKICDCLEALGNVRDWRWIAKLREQLAEDGSIGRHCGSNHYSVGHQFLGYLT